MKTLPSTFIRILITCLAILLVLTACKENPATQTPSMDVTQAYQTVEARLTQGILLTKTSTLTPTPTSTTTSPGVATVSQDASPTPRPDQPSPTVEERCDQAAPGFPSIDITVEDDSQMQPGQNFSKTWRLANVGTCTWSADYAVVWFSGEGLGAAQTVLLEESVAPGQSIDVSVDLVAPLEPGTYQGNWKLRNSNGDLFGIGPDGDSSFWVRITVPETGTATQTATPTATATPGVQASGSISLEFGSTVDLDSLQFNTANNDLAYNWLLVDEDVNKHQISTLGNTLLGLFGNSQPMINECQTAALGTSPLTVEDIDPGTYFCYRTDLGLPGWFRFDAYDPEDASVDITVLTWVLP